VAAEPKAPVAIETEAGPVGQHVGRQQFSTGSVLLPGIGSRNFFEAVAAAVVVSDAVTGVAGGSTTADKDDDADSVAMIGLAGSGGLARGSVRRRSRVAPGLVAEIHG
jgi:hypothetical protein